MSATTAPSATTPEPVFRPGVVPRAIAAFSGGPGVAVKVAFLALMNALAIWTAYQLIVDRTWIWLAVLVLATAAIDFVYLVPREWTVPLKFLIPGTVFLLGFQIAPILYTVSVAFTNYSTGHIGTKAGAVERIKENSLEPPPNGKQYTMAPARNGDGDLVLILRDDASGKTYIGTKDGLDPIPQSDVQANDLGITAAKGYALVKGAELFALDTQLRSLIVPTTGDSAIQPEGVTQAVELRPTLRYDDKRGVFVRLSDGAVFAPNDNGSFVHGEDELEPGWRTNIGFRNFTKIATNPLYRDPFLSVFIWTFAFAFLTVFLSFAVGLFLAIALDKPGLRFQKLYRSVLIIPYAIPGFLSLLVWAGLLNDDFGVVNRLFHLNVPWLFDANWAKVSIIIVSTWLTTPYFFLVAMGALQSIPAELTEAARVDGGGPFQIFRRVTLPLLLVATTPLLIASFAFNFNNFGNIYLLTGGGPATGGSSVAGATDILISYTYKLAIASGKGQDYGLASTISILIFLIVATISGVSFWRSKTLETVK